MKRSKALAIDFDAVAQALVDGGRRVEDYELSPAEAVLWRIFRDSSTEVHYFLTFMLSRQLEEVYPAFLKASQKLQTYKEIPLHLESRRYMESKKAFAVSAYRRKMVDIGELSEDEAYEGRGRNY